MCTRECKYLKKQPQKTKNTHFYYSGNHKMKGTVHVLFCVITRHTSGHVCNRGVMLITRAVTLVAWPFMLVTCSYMCKNGGEAPGQDAVGAS